MFGAQARLIVIHQNVEMAQEIIVSGGEGVIICQDGRIKFSTKKKIIPVDAQGCDLDKK